MVPQNLNLSRRRLAWLSKTAHLNRQSERVPRNRRVGGRVMSKVLRLVLFLLCCTAIGFAQNRPDPASQAPTVPPQTVHVSAADMTGMVDHKVLPQYPREALIKGIQGDVVFKIMVDENGKIVSSAPVQGHPLLVAASANALRDYTFHPYLVNGTPVKVASEMGFHFTLSRQGDSTNGHVECMSTIP